MNKRLLSGIGPLCCLVLCGTSIAGDPLRSEKHDAYASGLWQFLHRPGMSFSSWQVGDSQSIPEAGPRISGPVAVYLNGRAARRTSDPVPGATIVARHLDTDDPDRVLGVTVWYRVGEQYPGGGDNGWYWVHFLPDGRVAKTCVDRSSLDRRDFVTKLQDGRLWVFKLATPELLEFEQTGELAKHVTHPGAGPAGLTIKSADNDAIMEYMASRPGYVTRVHEGRLWVFSEDSPELASFDDGVVSDKHVTRPGAGPLGITLKAVSVDDLDGYAIAKTGFATFIADGRAWIFRQGDEALNEFETHGELAKHVTWPAAGPRGMTLKAPDDETLQEYVASEQGFSTAVQDGRVWVFRFGSPEWEEFLQQGEPAKCITRPGAGPQGMTVKGVDSTTLDAYLEAKGSD